MAGGEVSTSLVVLNMTEVDVIRIPGARPVYKQKAEKHLKEQNWDDRFVLGRIPAYDATKDRHCVALVASKKKKTVLAPGRIRRARSPSSTTQSKPPRSGSVKALGAEGRQVMRGNLVQKLRSDLVEEWNSEGVSEEVFTLVLRAIESGSAKARITAYAREMEDLRNHRSIVKALQDVITAREKSIRGLQRLVDLGDSRPLTEVEVRTAQEALLQHRLMTLHTVEHIAVFREHVYKVTQGDRKMFRVPVTWQGNNYLLQLKSDTVFLSSSCLSDFFEFSKKGDPFFVVPASQGLKRGKLDLPFPPALITRVKAAETVIMDEVNTAKDNQRTGSREGSRRPKPPEYPQTTFKRPEAGGNKQRLEDDLESPPRAATPRRIPSTDSLARPVTRGKGDTDLGPGVLSSKRLETEPKPPPVSDPIPIPDPAPSETTVTRPNPELPSPKEASIQSPVQRILSTPSLHSHGRITVAGIELPCEELKMEVEKYISELPIAIRESFWAPGEFETLVKQPYPAVLSLDREERRVGLLGLYIDTLATNVKRVFISHISATSIETLDQVLDTGLNFIWENFPCDEVRIAINYREIEGKMEADAQVKALIASKKFRWKNLTNTADGRRVIIMALVRPQDAPERPIHNSDLFSENLQVRYGVAAQVGSKSTISGPSGLFSYLGVAACLQELGGVEAAEMSHNELQLSLADFCSKLPPDFEFPAFRFTKSADINEALQDISSQSLELPGIEADLLTSTACSAIGLRFPSFDTVLRSLDIGVCEYIRVVDTVVNCAEVGKKRVYLFPSDDKQFNLMIITEERGDEDLNALESAQRIVTMLTKDEKAFNRTVSEIWVPGFKASGKSRVGDVCGLSTQQGTIRNCAEAYEISLNAPTHSVGGINVKPSPDSIVIEDAFVLGIDHTAIINSKLDDICPVPYCACHIPKSLFTLHSP